MFTQLGVTHVAKWSVLKKLHLMEERNLIKLSYLTPKSISPTPIERQKVSACLKIFCDITVAALRSHPC